MFNPTDILSSWSEFRLQPPSEHFVNCLRSLGDALTPSGQPVYNRATLINLTTSIASRSYGPELYRALYVLKAAALTNTSIDRLILHDTQLTGAMILQLFSNGTQSRLLIIEQQTLNFLDDVTDKQEMKISEQQLPLAIAMIEFLIEALGFEVVYQAYRKFSLTADNFNVKTTTKAFSATLYRFLGEHLPSASSRQMAQLLSNYLKSSLQATTPNRLGDLAPKDITPEDVTDEIIFNFWCDYANDETVSFRLFTTAAQAWITYRTAIKLAASDAFTTHQSFEQLFQEEQYNPSAEGGNKKPIQSASTLSDVIGQISAPTRWIDDLTSAPCDEIKFFTKVEQEDIGLPLLTGEAFGQLVLTCLRVSVFSPIQNKIVQEKREKSSVSCASIFNQISKDSYATVMKRWQEMKLVASGLCDTVFFRLWEARAPQAFDYFTKRGTEEERSALAKISKDQSLTLSRPPNQSIDLDSIAAKIFAALDTMPRSHPLNARKLAMQKTSHRYRRKGLVPNELNGKDAQFDWINALAIGGDRLHKIESFLSKVDFITQSQTTELKAKINADKKNFKEKLISLYEV